MTEKNDNSSTLTFSRCLLLSSTVEKCTVNKIALSNMSSNSNSFCNKVTINMSIYIMIKMLMSQEMLLLKNMW